MFDFRGAAELHGELRHGGSQRVPFQLTVVGLLMLFEGVTHRLGAQGLVDVRLDGAHGPAVAKVVEVEARREFFRNGLED